MRDNHEGLPEIIDAYDREGTFFGVAQVKLSDEFYAFEFGIDDAGYHALRQIIQLHPFDHLPGLQHRYFFVPSVRRIGKSHDLMEFAVRVEQGSNGKQFQVKGPESLISNLMWFFKLRRPEDAAQLRQVEARRDI